MSKIVNICIMNCKSIYRGSVSCSALKNVKPKVLRVIAACLFDNLFYLGIKDRLSLLDPTPSQVAFICDKYGIDEVEVIEQYPTSMFYEPYKCNYRVRLHSHRIYSVYYNSYKCN